MCLEWERLLPGLCRLSESSLQSMACEGACGEEPGNRSVEKKDSAAWRPLRFAQTGCSGGTLSMFNASGKETGLPLFTAVFRNDRVLESFADTEFECGFGGNLYRLACGRITSFTRLAF